MYLSVCIVYRCQLSFRVSFKSTNIFVGISYKCWHKTKVPLHIGVSKTIKNDSLEQKLKDYRGVLDYDDSHLFYISASKNLNDEAFDMKVENIRKRIIDIQGLIES